MNAITTELRSSDLLASTWQDLVDGCWERFVGSLPEGLQADARLLPLTLRLTPKPLPWSRIFHQEVTLGLPFTLAEALPSASPAEVRTAVEAHMLGIVAAFGADRIDDGQVEATPELVRVLDEVRRARDAAIDSFGVGGVGPTYDYRAADLATTEANRAEQEFLALHASATTATYEELSRPKQYLVFPAAMTFSRAAGLGDASLSQVEAMCLAMAMGLQLRDDATDWEDDHAEGRAWAVRLMLQREGEGVYLRDIESLRLRMADSGVVVELLRGAVRHFEAASAAASALAAHRVAAWCDRQASLTQELAAREDEAPGHIVRWEKARKQARA
ncbi:MAG: hypothetical protein ABJE95_27585 [Byssovorax sp.]